MAKKKSIKKKKGVSRTRVEPYAGFFKRLKDILPEQKKETVRVKTYIMEKPVYVPSSSRLVPPPQKYGYLGETEKVEKIDSRKSRYSRKRSIEEEDFTGEPGEEAPISEDTDISDSGDNEELVGGDDLVDSESNEDLVDEDSLEEPEQGVSQKHLRSRVMFEGVWWKRALFWAILFWLLILGIAVIMGAMKLVDLNLRREWWLLLGGIIVVMMIYERFFSKK